MIVWLISEKVGKVTSGKYKGCNYKAHLEGEDDKLVKVQPLLTFETGRFLKKGNKSKGTPRKNQ